MPHVYSSVDTQQAEVSRQLRPDTNVKLTLNYDRQSVDQSVLVSGDHLGPLTNFPFSLKFSLDNCEFVIL
jgi:hypothetical protein